MVGLLVPYLRARGCRATDAEVRATYRACTRGEMTTAELWDTLGVADAATDEGYCTAHRLTRGVVDTLQRLTGAGITVACLTNDTTEWSALLRRRFHLDRHIHHWYVSADIGVRKPDPRAYDALLRGLGVPASRVLFVDDRGPNLAAAREAGMRTILFTSEDTDRHPIPAGIPRVDTMAGLVAATGV